MEEGFAPSIHAIAKWDKELRNELRKELRASGEMVAAGARLLADAHSTSISPTIKVRTRIQSRKAEVEIKAGGGKVPIAGLFELGNKGSKSASATRGGRFRHPVFGNKSNWVDQDMHPYMGPTVKLREAAVTRRIGAAVDKANVTVGL